MTRTMRTVATIVGILLVLFILWDGFEALILPRRVTRRFRLTRLFFRSTWPAWSAVTRRMKAGRRREAFLSIYGPLSLLLLFVLWAVGLIFGFALLHWAAGSAQASFGQTGTFWSDLYLSGTTFTTLGLGDIAPRTWPARFITVLESGTGFGFLAVVISYLPVLYGAFSRREVNISLLDARAGSPPTAAELLRRHAPCQNPETLGQFLRSWEAWSAELMESHLSFPVLCYFRSQHDNQSWLAALTAILDTCALLISYAEGALRWQAQLTFAISRHALVDLAQVMGIPPQPMPYDRLPGPELDQLRKILSAAGIAADKCGSEQRLRDLRSMYEPYVAGFSQWLLMSYPGWKTPSGEVDNWKTSAWGKISSQSPAPTGAVLDEEHR